MSVLRWKIDYELREISVKLRLYEFMGWNTDWIMAWRHEMLVLLLKDQLKEFNRD